MLNQYEVPFYLVDKLPEIEQELKSISVTSNVFEIIKWLANYTRHKVMQHDPKSVKKCFTIADNIYSQGNMSVKNAIENVFVCSISSVLNLGTRCEKRELHALVPLYLYTAYMQQVLKPAI